MSYENKKSYRDFREERQKKISLSQFLADNPKFNTRTYRATISDLKNVRLSPDDFEKKFRSLVK